MRDIKKLLEIDPENSAGLKEEGVVKELWTKVCSYTHILFLVRISEI